MTVEFRGIQSQVAVDKVLYSDNNAAKALVKWAMLGQLEARIDMAIDNQDVMCDGELSKDGLQSMLREAVVDGTSDFLADAMADLVATVLAAAKSMQTSVVVRGLSYDANGKLSDITVDFAAE